MIDGRKVLGLIPARGGSKGLPGKNVADLAGRPLIAWTIEAARRSHYIDRLILSCDDEAICAVARTWGCEVPFVRPEELARDETPSVPVVLHALETLGEDFDILVFLQPTSPLRSTEDIDACIEHCRPGGAPACIAVTEPAKSPFWAYTMDGEGRLAPLIPRPPSGGPTRRQELPTVFAPNGAVYVAHVPWFRQHRAFLSTGTVGHVMPAERSVDIDGPIDLKLAALLIQDARDGKE